MQRQRPGVVRYRTAGPKPSLRRTRPPPQPKCRRHIVELGCGAQRLKRHLRGMLRRPQRLRRRVQPRCHPGREIGRNSVAAAVSRIRTFSVRTHRCANRFGDPLIA